ncbi:hypothetical protein A3D11_00735 [Candidatus Peribacteria bacterium RIFCSPHIGHO2_02_FULL_49_16]|nr:MAG: hypothetical protein A2880_01400 [Candidatus Peribacteria bacterium RIFCSPHIGHO2_01_FULL_49_38]OGJ60055.1 MAG: hypothetical protein A3D11_00735 [Candidatus Peribacteria bacterium RIFCSPHIGHO2_02_FULL_49_16]
MPKANLEPRTYPGLVEYVEVQPLLKELEYLELSYGRPPLSHRRISTLRADTVAKVGMLDPEMFVEFSKQSVLPRPRHKTTVWLKHPGELDMRFPTDLQRFLSVAKLLTGFERSHPLWLHMRIRMAIDACLVRKGYYHRFGGQPHQDVPRIPKDSLSTTIYTIYDSCPTMFMRRKPLGNLFVEPVTFAPGSIVKYSGLTWHVPQKMEETRIRNFVALQCNVSTKDVEIAE